MDIDINELCDSIIPNKWDKNSNKFIAIFNVGPDKGVERQIVEHGIRGVFYRNDPLDMLSRGILEILKGDLWFSRKTMSELLLQKKSANTFAEHSANPLTFREQDILIGIAAGSSNQELANELGISLHTVKTHIYNIYKKIKVSNRLQAALWAAQHL